LVDAGIDGDALPPEEGFQFVNGLFDGEAALVDDDVGIHLAGYD